MVKKTFESHQAKICLRAMLRAVKAQIRLGLHCPLTDPLDTTECIIRDQRPGCYFAHAQDDLNRRILHIFEDSSFA